MSWRVEIVEVLNNENDFEGEEWWAVTDDNKMENTFEVRNEQVAMDLCNLLNSREIELSIEQIDNKNRVESQEWLRNKIKELEIDLRCLDYAIEKASQDFNKTEDLKMFNFSAAVFQRIYDYYNEMLEDEGVCSHLEEISLKECSEKLIIG